MRDAKTPEFSRRMPRLAPLVAFAWIALSGTLAYAQDEIDVEPPLVEHVPIERGVPGVAQEFEATVVDDRELAEVLLFHRFAGDASFDETPMRPIASSSVFTASIPTVAGDTRAIEYYIQARDEAGNRVIKGYAFSPLVRRMGDDASAGATASAPAEPAARTGGGRRWLYIGLGVLAVGAAAAALASDDDETNPDAFTLTIDPPR